MRCTCTSEGRPGSGCPLAQLLGSLVILHAPMSLNASFVFSEMPKLLLSFPAWRLLLMGSGGFPVSHLMADLEKPWLFAVRHIDHGPHWKERAID